MKPHFLLFSLGLLAIACERTTVPDPKPLARFEAPVSVNIGEEAQFYDRSTNANSYSWTWGDGTTETGPSPSHRYERAGRFRVLLQVTGPGGQDSTSSVIQVMRGGTTVVTSLPGTYRGRLFFSSSLPGNPPTYQSWQRDTTLQLTLANATTISFFNQSMSYAPGSYAWLGHRPSRNNFFFGYSFPYSNHVYLQVEQAGDSIFFDKRSGGLAGGTTYKFYGVKLP